MKKICLSVDERPNHRPNAVLMYCTPHQFTESFRIGRFKKFLCAFHAVTKVPAPLLRVLEWKGNLEGEIIGQNESTSIWTSPPGALTQAHCATPSAGSYNETLHAVILPSRLHEGRECLNIHKPIKRSISAASPKSLHNKP